MSRWSERRRDSSFVLYYATQVLHLRTLALHYDNGFCHPHALTNVREICHRTGADLLDMSSQAGLNARIAAASFHLSIPFGPGAALHFCCHHCFHGGMCLAYSLAHRFRIPFLLWGDSFEERMSFKPIKRKVMKFRSPLQHLLCRRGPTFLKMLGLLMAQRNVARPPGNSPFNVQLPKLKSDFITELHIFEYTEWDRNRIKSVITEELGWSKPPERLSSWRFDCLLHAVVNYCHKKAVGFNHDVDGLANMVRAGKMTREEAMHLIDQGFDSDAWTDEVDHVVRNMLRLPESDIRVMQSWSFLRGV